ncbi:hypothetical protein JOC75_000768 [Metabacillus crassostreae]|uniref:hypothetical protein n=1 Tax=Metabacillus crassostreae TaxID=929098 RepID=UPI0019575615|nr:hypothetical protein [Metabacillus crassostreae]MBM7602798.1 hypothetical protein [Metabacillus crassostreae]
MYEVTWLAYEIFEELGRYEQVHKSLQFDSLEEAKNFYNNQKEDIDVEHIKLTILLEEFSRAPEVVL